jgi:hypothetical protein
MRHEQLGKFRFVMERTHHSGLQFSVHLITEAAVQAGVVYRTFLL